ncbi:MAG: cell division protein SepF [Quinella sp. 3Q1]|nr:cell division protein SepF [Quinella sp. 3Q1]
MGLMDWIKKITDYIIPPVDSETEEETKETKKVDAKAEDPKPAHEPQPANQNPQPAAPNFQADKQTTGSFAPGFNNGTMSFTRHGGMVTTSENGVTSMGGVRYEAYNSDTSEASVRPSLAVVKTPSLTMKIYAPTKFDDQVKQIADDLLKHNAVIVNFEGVDDIEQQRIGDFIIGAVYMIDGQAEMVSSKIVLYVPKGIEYESAAAKIPMRRYN